MMLTAALMSLLISAEPDVLRFTVSVDSNKGQVRCAVYQSEDTWLSKKVVTGTSAKVLGKRAICVFRGLKPGRYAISAYHDEDEDGRLDTNFLGIPKEDYCASRDARGRIGPPAFSDAAFRYAGGVLELSARAR